MPTSRRRFLTAGLGALASLAARPIRAAAATADRLVIVNADDFGMSAEIDRGILEAHDRGIVTSASLLVDEPDAESAVREAHRRPKLGLGIHVAFDSRGKWLIDVKDLEVVHREIHRQIDRFIRMTGAPPDHIDSHHHVHRLFNVAYLFLDAARQYRVPVRGLTEVVFVGRFYGQPEFGKTDLSKIGVEAMIGLFQSLKPGVSEVSCHPGTLESRPDAVYNREREVELQTLTDPRVRSLILEEGIRLINYRDYARLHSAHLRSE
ncbi:MAG TPA: ChbG/HpnK family deacetylase [Methylomirabilota bacterium]